tara:strand:- start:54 stop:905 length:852 start_codon:yes stop_codon:yes gene_type:complete
MIIWLASYPKSGNTWVRSLISSYYFSKDSFKFSDLKKIPNFSVGDFIKDKYLLKSNTDVTRQWLQVQELINKQYKKALFFKTHNACVSVNNNNFTNSDYSAGCIYIVRDPRNVITSYKNFEGQSYEEVFNHMNNQDGFLFGNKNFETTFGFKGFEYISSWSNNYNSWVKNKQNVPICIVKYEDLIKNTLGQLKKIITFIGRVQNINNFKFNLEKGLRAVADSDFKKLSQMEMKEEFQERSKNQLDSKFFNLGQKNNWETILPRNIKEQIEENFGSEMKELNYL